MLLNIKNFLSLTLAHRLFAPCYIGLIILYSFVGAPGYEVYTSDQALFLPPFFHSLDESLFPNDLEWFRIMFVERTILTDILAVFTRMGVPVIWTLFVWTIVLRILFFSSIFFIVRYFTENRLYALVALLFFITPLKTFGTGHGTMETAFSYRTSALAFGLLFTALYLHGKTLTGVPAILLSFMVHPITAVPFLLFYAGMEITAIMHAPHHALGFGKRILIWILIGLGISIFLSFKANGVSESLSLRIDEAWKQLAYPRNSPAFFAFWDRNSYLSLGLWTLLGGIPYLLLSSLVKDIQKRRALYILGAIPLLLIAISAIGEYFLLHGIVKFNLQRGLFIINIVTAILIGFLAFEHAEKERNKTLEHVFLFSLLAWFLYKADFIFLQEQALFFIPPLIILFYGPRIVTSRKALSITATALFLIEYGVVFERSLHYQAWAPLIIFHCIIFTGIGTAYAYKKNMLSSDTFLTFLVSGAALFLTGASILSAREFTIYPAFTYNKAYMDACAWIGNNTEKGDVFIVEPFVSGEPAEFRLACWRPIFTTFKDGGISPYGREEAFEWKKKYDLLYDIPGNWMVIENIKQQYRVDYIFSAYELPIGQLYPLRYSNGHYFIYSLRSK